MKTAAVFSLLIIFSFTGFSQATDIQLNAQKVQMYSPYMAARHGGFAGLEQYKNTNTYAYTREMWYFTESFYIKRNHSSEGVAMNSDAIDITRFEQYRKASQEAVVEIPGFKDAIVLLPAGQLVFKPDY